MVLLNKTHGNLDKVNPGRDEKLRADGTWGEVIDLFEKGVIVEFEDNRKNGNYSEKTAQKVRTNFDILKAGVIHVAKLADGRYKLADVHSRIAGLVFRGMDGNFTTTERKSQADIYVVHELDHLKTYQGLNDQNGHSLRDKLCQPHSAAGAYIINILNLVNVTFSKEFWLNLTDVIIAFSVCDGVSNDRAMMTEVFQARGQATGRIANGILSFEDFVTAKHVIKIRQALCYIKDIMRSMHENRFKSMKGYQELIKGAPGLWMYLMSDFLSDRKIADNQTAAQTGAIIMGHTSDVMIISQTVARRNRKNIQENDIKEFDKILMMRYKDSKRAAYLREAAAEVKSNPNAKVGDYVTLLKKKDSAGSTFVKLRAQLKNTDGETV